jgi:hypothetical protein
VTVDDVVEAIYRRLCIRQQAQGQGADMGLVELRLALGVTEAALLEAVDVLRLAVAAVRTLVPALVVAEMDRMRGQLDGIDVDAIDNAFDPANNPADRAMLLDAVRTTIPVLLREQINKFRGRID